MWFAAIIVDQSIGRAHNEFVRHDIQNVSVSISICVSVSVSASVSVYWRA